MSLCLSTGALQFWIVEQKKKTLTVFHRDGTRQVFGAGTEIPLSDFGRSTLRVDEIFQ